MSDLTSIRTDLSARLDLAAWRRQLAETEARLATLKQALRVRWERPMSAEQREAVQLARRATWLCLLRALGRGRLHLRRPLPDLPALHDSEFPLDYHHRMALRAGQRLQLWRADVTPAPAAENQP
jgi:hypothetical protein